MAYDIWDDDTSKILKRAELEAKKKKKELLIRAILIGIIVFQILYFNIKIAIIKDDIYEAAIKKARLDILIEMSSERNRAITVEDSIYFENNKSIINK